MSAEDPISLVLPPCPICSNMHAIHRPSWSLCRHTSRERGEEHYRFLGCHHAANAGGNTMHARGEITAKIESDWTALIVDLFDFKTQDWDGDRREEFRQKLGQPFIPPPIQQSLTTARQPKS